MNIRSIYSGMVSSKSSYKENRKILKNGFLVSFCIMAKSSMSIGMMNNQRYYFLTGWGLGLILGVGITFLLGYNMILVSEIANDIERKNKMVEVDTFEGISYYLSNNNRTNRTLYFRKFYLSG